MKRITYRLSAACKGVFAAILMVLSGGCSPDNALDIVGFVWTRSGDTDSRFAQSVVMDNNCGHSLPASVTAGSDNYMVYLITDSHLNHTHGNLDAFMKDFRRDDSPGEGHREIPMVLHLGDLIDARQDNNFADAKKWLGDVWDRLFITPGNHDLYFDQWKKFLDTCGCGSYYIEVLCPSGAMDMYICMDSASGTLGVKQKKWMENTLAAAKERGYRHIVVFTHTHFFHNDQSQFPTSNFTLEETCELNRMFSMYGVKTVLSGHDHYPEYNRFNGIDYHVVAAKKDGTEDPGYAILNVSAEGISLQHKKL